MEKDEIVKEIRTLIAAKQSEESVVSFLKELGFSEEDTKKLIERAKEGFAIEEDLEKLRGIEDKRSDLGEERELNPQEKKQLFVKDQISDIQEIIKAMKIDINAKPEKKGSATVKK